MTKKTKALLRLFRMRKKAIKFKDNWLAHECSALINLVKDLKEGDLL